MTAYGAVESLPSGEIVPGSVLNWAYKNAINQHLPYLSIQIEQLTKNIYDTVFYFEDGDVNKITGHLAEQWTPDADGLGYNVILHDNVKFTNGRPLTAQSCIDCWKYAKKYVPSFFSNIERIDAVNERTLYFKFNKPFPLFMQFFADSVTGIADPASIEQYGDSDNKAAIGSGPYKIEKYVAGEVLTLKANEDYWFEPKKPSVETVNIYYIPDVNTVMTALEAGEIDYYETQNIQAYYTMLDLPHFNVIPIKYNQFTMWTNEKRAPVLGKLEVRKALSMLIDWQGVCDLVYDGLWYPTKGIWTPGSPAAVDSPYYIHDPEQGLALLKEAGVDPKSISLEFLCYQSYEDVALAVQAQLAQYGIKIKINVLESATVVSLEQSNEWDLRMGFNSYWPATPLVAFTIAVQKAGNTRCVFFEDCDPEASLKIESMYAEAVNAKTAQEQGNILHELTAYLQEKCVTVGGFQIIRWAALSDKFTNFICDNNKTYADVCYLRLVK
jgi:ABC-type transport system substrate-binding protein